jgi:hypothetical protein
VVSHHRLCFDEGAESYPFSSYYPANGRALLGPQASSPANVATLGPLGQGWQARTPAVPEEASVSRNASLKGTVDGV